MLSTTLKNLIALLLLFGTSPYFAQIDSISNKFAIELNTDYYVGTNWNITDATVVNYNITYGAGLYMGYNFSPERKFLIGANYLKSNNEFKIIRRNVLGSDGSITDIQDFRENIELLKYSFGFMYSYEVSSRSSVDVELQLIYIINETRQREGTFVGFINQTGTMFNGLNFKTKESSYAIKLKYKHMLSDHLYLGIGGAVASEIINVPLIDNDSIFNLSIGISLVFLY